MSNGIFKLNTLANDVNPSMCILSINKGYDDDDSPTSISTQSTYTTYTIL